MVDQLSRVGKGMILALLMLGFSYKGSYGKIPANLNLSEYLKLPSPYDLRNSRLSFNELNSFIVKYPDGTAMIVLVGHDPVVTAAVQKLTGSKRFPLIFSVSTLPFNSVQFDPSNFQFEQDHRRWRPFERGETVFPFGKDSEFGGQITGDQIHQGIILLPAWFDIERAIKIKYSDNERLVNFEVE